MEGIPGSLRGVSRHGQAFRVVSASLRIFRPVLNLPKEGWAARLQHPRRRVRREDERGFATGLPEVRSTSAPWEQNAHARHSQAKARKVEKHIVLDDDPPKRSSDVVKRPVPRSHRTEPYSPWGVHAAKAATGAGNARGAGARSSFGWQTSVGRIARLLHREVARPVGEREGASQEEVRSTA